MLAYHLPSCIGLYYVRNASHFNRNEANYALTWLSLGALRVILYQSRTVNGWLLALIVER